jgi:hypothetical protein
MPEEWVFLAEAFNDVEAEIICGLLQASGIPCRKEDRDSLTGAMRVIGGLAYEIRIMVPKPLLKQAQALLRSAGEKEEIE